MTTRHEPHAPAIVEGAGSGAPSPRADLARELGGMHLGMTVDEFNDACGAAGGTAARVAEIDLSCGVAPAPLRGPGGPGLVLGGTMNGKFCAPGVRLCELVYSVDGPAAKRDEQTGALVATLVAAYGPPQGRSGDDEPMAQCRKERYVQFAREWSFAPEQSPPHPRGRARVVFGCDLRVSADSHHLKVVYTDESGLRYASGDHTPHRHDH